MIKIKHLLSLLLGFFVATISFTTVFAAGNYGLDDTAKVAFGSTPEGNVTTIIGNILGTGLAMISVVFFILMIYGGIMYMTARGKDDQSKKAIDTIWAAIIGIIIVLSAYALTNFVFSAVSGNVGGGGAQQPPPPLQNDDDSSLALAWCSNNSAGTCTESSEPCDNLSHNSEDECVTYLEGQGPWCIVSNVCTPKVTMVQQSLELGQCSHWYTDYLVCNVAIE